MTTMSHHRQTIRGVVNSVDDGGWPFLQGKAMVEGPFPGLLVITSGWCPMRHTNRPRMYKEGMHSVSTTDAARGQIDVPGLLPKDRGVSDIPIHWSIGVGGVTIRSNFRVHFVHPHMWDMIFIVEEVNRLHPHCPDCNIFVLSASLNHRHPYTSLCTRSAEWKLQRLVDDYVIEGA